MTDNSNINTPEALDRAYAAELADFSLNVEDSKGHYVFDTKSGVRFFIDKNTVRSEQAARFILGEYLSLLKQAYSAGAKSVTEK